jgi:VWFA-related protein
VGQRLLGWLEGDAWVIRAGLAVAMSAMVGAQQPQAPPVFRTGTDLVTVDALVTDSQGHVATGLTADDFRITEKGRSQTISAFSFVTAPPVDRLSPDPEAMAPVRDVVTNRATPHSRVFAVVVDDMHLVAMHEERVRRVLTDILQSIPDTDRVAVVFTGRSDLSINLTDDPAALREAVGRVRGALGFAMDPSPVVCGAKEVQRRQQALGSLSVLTNVAMLLARTRADERTVIYLSEGFNFDFAAMPNSNMLPMVGLGVARIAGPDPEQTCDPSGQPATQVSTSPLPGDPQENVSDADLVRRTLQELLTTATRADVRIYTIDPRGNLPVDADVMGPPPRDPVAVQALQSKVSLQNDFLRSVASGTGGEAAVQRSDMSGAVRELFADTSSYYLLGYTPDPFLSDGVYHPIEVTVTRAGLHLRARKGYAAPVANPSKAVGATALGAALAEGDVTNDLVLSAFVAPMAASGKLTKTAVIVEVSYPGPAALPATIADDLQLEIVAADVEGKARVASTRAFHFSVTPTRPGDLVFFLNDVVDFSPGTSSLRLGIVSKTSGKVGTVAVPVRIPNLSDASLQIASVVLGLKGAREPAMPAEALSGLVPFQPTLARSFQRDDTLRVFAPLSWDGPARTATVSLTVTGLGVPLTQTFETGVERAGSGLQHAVIDRSLALLSLAPGDYVLAVTANLPGGQPVTRTIGFRVG